MEVLENIKDLKFNRYNGIGLGNFDGLHIGHMALLNILISECRLYGYNSMVYTFKKHPENIINKPNSTLLLMTPEKKSSILEVMPMDYVFYEEFDEEFSKMQPAEFVKKILVDRLNIRLAVAGFDYTFGYKGLGNVKLLEELGKEYGFRTLIIPTVKIDDEVVSSTRIRKCLLEGHADKAFYMLGRHYSIIGTVEEGFKMGQELGFPTANITPAPYLLMPSFGVYMTKTIIEDRLYSSITNVGMKPTVTQNRSRANIETHILDFDNDLYNKSIEVFFLKKLRNEIKFDTRDELREQIRSDIEKARNIFKKLLI